MVQWTSGRRSDGFNEGMVEERIEGKTNGRTDKQKSIRIYSTDV